MHLFFLILFIVISSCLICLILIQPGKGFNNTSALNINNIKLLSNIGKGDFTTKIIGIFSCLFLLISIILCNINNKITESDYFWENHKKNIVLSKNKQFTEKKELKSDIPR